MTPSPLTLLAPFNRTIHATTRLDRSKLRVLWGPRRLHHLNGNVITPLFRHLGSSSWHSWDAGFLKALKKTRIGVLPCLVVVVSFSVAVYNGAKAALRRHQRRRRREVSRGRGRVRDGAGTCAEGGRGKVKVKVEEEGRVSGEVV